ncbi:hypothetical protein ACFQY5_26525 [Paeniroseomonas aquatica]|uniref:Uncharacterized protein n=1 Tax=Paeniroseomonas aquatica TaxID=373043 RepID=A0ABT8AAV1_9PROT|nr:hypothetical protein [Paeniroseomonas aquatica]MDN3566886.1 hypothetical protein [Paeniroseomonas aquatica]
MNSRLTLVAPLTLLAALAGCAEPQATRRAAPTTRVYANDLAGGAKLCTVQQPVSLTAGQPTETTMVLDNDGGWCGILVSQPGPKPFDLGLVETRPTNGRLHIRKVGDNTRVDYIPNAAFGGSDAFAVRLMPGGATLRVAVTVNYTAPAAPPPPPARAATPPPRRTPAAAPARRK